MLPACWLALKTGVQLYGLKSPAHTKPASRYFHATDTIVHSEPFLKNCAPYYIPPNASRTMQDRVGRLLPLLTHFKRGYKHRHVFLASRDRIDISQALLNVAHGSKALLLHYGPRSFPNEVVVPPSDAGFSRPLLPLQPPAHFLFLMLGLINSWRKVLFSQIERLQRESPSLSIELHKIIGHRLMPISTEKAFEKMQASLLCPIAQGDQPYQHRFYDVILAGCVPLLFVYPVQEAKDAAKGKEIASTVLSCEAWSWQPGSGFAHRNKPCVDFRSSCAENAYPFTGPKGVPYYNLTERVDAEVLSTKPPPQNGSSTHQVTRKPLSAQLAAVDHQRLLAKRQALQQYRQWFAYDWSGGTFDAFSATMQEVCLLLRTEGPWRMSESRATRMAF